MPGIDWTYLGSIGGEGIEDFAATCLRRRHSDAHQTRPASGDGGIDVYRETPDGLIVWQIKRFTTRVTPDQCDQIKRSWRRFWETHVEAGTRIVSYTLATPWTPTDPRLAWFRDEVTNEATFPVSWEGAPFFNALADEFPATFERLSKGQDMLENMVTAKSVLAASPVEQGDAKSMLEAIAAREDALRSIKDMVSDNYDIDTSIVRAPPGTTPSRDPAWPHPSMHARWTRIDEHRWKVDSVVPRNDQSGEVEPIHFNVRFLVDPGTPEADAVEEWQTWGVPFSDVRADTQVTGGPFAEEMSSVGVVSLGAAELPTDLPRLDLRSLSDQPPDPIPLVVKEVTRGSVGGGLRVTGGSLSGVIEVEARVSSSIAPSSFGLQLAPAEGQKPAAVARDLERLEAIAHAGQFACGVEDGPDLAVGSDLVSPPIAGILLHIARDLARLQPHTTEKLLMPDIATVTEWQFDQLHRLATIYDQGAITETWERLVFTIDDSGFLRDSRAGLDGTGALVQREYPEFKLGETSYLITRELAHTHLTPKLAPHIDRAALVDGSELELVPGDDNRLVHAVIVDDG